VTDLLTAIGLAIAIEGIVYALFPDAMKNFMEQILAQPSGNLRKAGLVAAAVGVFVIWLVRGTY
jgi:uncharacterized protein